MASLIFVCTILLTSAVSTIAAPTGPAQPPCTPVPQLPISYIGAISGCTSQPGGNARCVVGEDVQFKYGDGVVSCCPASYVWQFEGGPINSGTVATITHQFTSPGSYTVKVSAYACPDPVVVSITVTVVDRSAIPTLSNTVAILLFLSLLMIAAFRLK